MTTLETGQNFIFKCVSHHRWKKKSQNYSVWIHGKSIYETFPLHWDDLIINPSRRATHRKFSQKSLPSHKRLFLEKKPPPTLGVGRGGEGETLKSPCFKSFIFNICGRNYDLSSKTTKPLVFFKVISYGYEIFQTALILRCKII